ncbi:hypothetical protein GGH12_005871 [Coemansia sp. RSA 1822]|nr:hypothetical protein LPJ76_005962 [Coemansia sp. RSA 638]KAJ2119079.1 hypothetical protein IW147_006131 [Coemansia sp. RSA 720]KAJ2538676.1 hypothetical protein GGF49_005766 [Coemansia sp. RSA 1853]KAJ2558404.1 hypothetical protein GGH12_005871 [Coemansia sp. RSA 1822]
MSAVAKSSPAVTVKKARGGRKNKSDWRGKIDLGDVEQGLEEMREEERQGGVIEKRGDADLFVMDTAGDEKTKARVRQKKVLRLDEILGKRSNVPIPVLGTKLGEERKRRRETFELRKRLKNSAGFVEGRRTTARGIQQSKEINAFDIWGATGEAATVSKKQKSVVSRQKMPHVAALPAVEVAHPGASYRPAAKDHKQLVEKASKEYAAELRKDGKYEKFTEFRGLQHNDGLNECAYSVIKEMAQTSATESSDEDKVGEDETVYGSDDDAAKSAKDPKRKTRADRNRQRRATLRLEEEQKAKDMKEHMRQLRLTKHLNNVVKSETAEHEASIERRREELQRRAAQPRKRVGKHNVPQDPEAVQLTEELAGSLRQLQPESNNFTDMYNSFVKRNIIEPNGPMKVKRTSWKIKTTEKWSYKDFK